ncbi:helix-turn-helix transcriptional regulator [Noviherbaspirillum sp. L7-7A]|nr:helix-turn-helix transcriptional regulator [Noviherbaspirillum sp. L7-7A]
MTVSDAALVANVSIQTLVDVEAGRPGVSIGKILQIADALGVSLFVALAVQREALRSHIRHTASSENEK